MESELRGLSEPNIAPPPWCRFTLPSLCWVGLKWRKYQKHLLAALLVFVVDTTITCSFCAFPTVHTVSVVSDKCSGDGKYVATGAALCVIYPEIIPYSPIPNP